MFFFVTFAWLGASHPPRTSLKFLPLAGAAYLMPLVVADPSAEALSSAVFALPVCVFVGEAVAWMARRLRQTLTALDLANRARHRPSPHQPPRQGRVERVDHERRLPRPRDARDDRQLVMGNR